MFSTSFRYDPKFQKDAKGVTDKTHLLDRIIDKNEVILKASGSPLTLWKYFPFGPDCVCEKNNLCDVCYGTGFVNGYQKYGYNTFTYGSTSVGRTDKFGLTLTNVHVVTIPNQIQSQAFVLSTGVSGYVETNWIPFTNLVKHTYIKSRIFTPARTSITYAYTTDGVTYNFIYDLKNLDIPTDIPQIKIRITLARESADIPSPALNIFKYRIQVRQGMDVYDHRYGITEPAFLASKKLIERTLKLEEAGANVNVNPRWWALPDVRVSERDIGMFLIGNHKDQRFEFQGISISEHAMHQRVLHTEWNSRFIFSEKDVLGIAYLLD